MNTELTDLPAILRLPIEIIEKIIELNLRKPSVTSFQSNAFELSNYCQVNSTFRLLSQSKLFLNPLFKTSRTISLFYQVNRKLQFRIKSIRILFGSIGQITTFPDDLTSIFQQSSVEELYFDGLRGLHWENLIDVKGLQHLSISRSTFRLSMTSPLHSPTLKRLSLHSVSFEHSSSRPVFSQFNLTSMPALEGLAFAQVLYHDTIYPTSQDCRFLATDLINLFSAQIKSVAFYGSSGSMIDINFPLLTPSLEILGLGLTYRYNDSSIGSPPKDGPRILFLDQSMSTPPVLNSFISGLKGVSKLVTFPPGKGGYKLPSLPVGNGGKPVEVVYLEESLNSIDECFFGSFWSTVGRVERGFL